MCSRGSKRTLGRKGLKLKDSSHPKKLPGHLNINSNDFMKNTKINLPSGIIATGIHILMITGTKLSETFPFSQFLRDNFYISFRLNSNKNSRGMFFLQNVIKQLKKYG